MMNPEISFKLDQDYVFSAVTAVTAVTANNGAGFRVTGENGDWLQRLQGHSIRRSVTAVTSENVGLVTGKSFVYAAVTAVTAVTAKKQ